MLIRILIFLATVTVLSTLIVSLALVSDNRVAGAVLAAYITGGAALVAALSTT